ncbi:MDR family MFS transporter [Enterococcus sp. LJL98]
MNTTNCAVDQNGQPYHRLLLILVLLVGTFCTILNETLLSTAYPKLMADFKIDASTVQWLTTGFLLVNGIMIPFTAYLIGKFGARKLYLTAMFTFLVGTMICYSAKDFQILLIGRLVQGLGVGVTMPLLQTIMLTIFPPEKRGAAMGSVGIVIGLAPALGPTLSGWMIDHYSWRMLFGMILPIVLVVLILSVFFMKEVLPLTNPTMDLLSILLSTLGFGSLLYGFSSVGNKSWTNPEVLFFIFAGIVIICIFAKRQQRLDPPFLELRVFQSKNYTVATVLGGLSNMAMIGAEMILPMYLQEVLGKSPFESGLILLPGALLLGVMMFFTGHLFDKIGARQMAITGMFLLTSATFPFAFLTATTPIPYIMMLYAVRMFGISMVMMPVTTSGMNALPEKLMSHGTAVNSTFRQISSSIGTAVLMSVSTTISKKNLPNATLLKESPFLYQAKEISATLKGYHGAFVAASIFGAIGFIGAFLLTKKEVEHQ